MNTSEASLFLQAGHSSEEGMQAYVLRRGIEIQNRLPDARAGQYERLRQVQQLHEEIEKAIHRAWLEQLPEFAKKGENLSSENYKKAKLRLYPSINLLKKIFDAQIDIVHDMSKEGVCVPSSRNKQLRAVDRAERERYKRAPNDRELACGELIKFQNELTKSFDAGVFVDLPSISDFLLSVKTYLELHSEGRLSGEELTRAASYLTGRSSVIAEQNPLEDDD